MSFTTFYMHLIFGRIPSLINSELILYILPALTISILFFSLKIMSFTTYYMHLIFARTPSLISSDLILYILPALTVLILFFSFKIMFFKTPKLRKVK